MSEQVVRVPTAWVEFRVGDTCQARGRRRTNYFTIERFGWMTTIAAQGERPQSHQIAYLRNERTGKAAEWCWITELLPDDRKEGQG